MHLERLACGHPQGAVAEAIGQIIEGQIQRGRNATAGAAQAQHHLPVFFLAFLPVFAVVLLIAAVKLEQLNSAFAEVGTFVLQLFGEGIAQVGAIGLQLLELAAISAVGDAR